MGMYVFDSWEVHVQLPALDTQESICSNDDLA